MKKWTILGIVALAAILLSVQYVLDKKKTAIQAGGGMPAIEEPVGVALPEGATSYMARQAENVMPEAGGAVYGSISLPTIQTVSKGACEGGSLREMLATHDKYWGFFAWDTPFTQAETQKMYALLADFVACHAAARTDVTLCDSLPGPAEKKGYKVTLEMTPSNTCRKKTTNLLFESYLAGNIQGDSYCRLGLSGWDQGDLARFSVPEFCGVLAKGPENAAPFLLKAFAPTPPEAAARLAMDFPVKEADCRKDGDCLVKYNIYKSLKSGRSQGCPKEYVPHCQALTDRSTASCEKLLQNMSEFYCSSVKRVKKVTGGYIGMTKEEIAADIERTKAAKAEGDNIKKAQDKALEEVNKRVKEMLHKK